jgi:hypothetical protein
MSLAIQVDKVKRVLLADGWHEVAEVSFDLDAYEYLHKDHILLGGGACDQIPHTGFIFKEQNRWVCEPETRPR